MPEAPSVAMKLAPLVLAEPVAAPPPAQVRVGQFGAPHGLTPAPAATVKIPVLGQFGGATVAKDPSDPPSSPPAGVAGFASATVPAGPGVAGEGEHPARFGDAGAASAPPPRASLELNAFGTAAPPAAARTTSIAPAAPELVPPEVLSWPKPAYTPAAVSHEIQGEVVLEVRLRADGGVEVLRVIQGLGYGLDASAIAAARQLQFRPARNHGQPVNWTVRLHVQFRLAN